jgi:hypothetical protein
VPRRGSSASPGERNHPFGEKGAARRRRIATSPPMISWTWILITAVTVIWLAMVGGVVYIAGRAR